MATVLSMKELRNMQVADLNRDVSSQRGLIAKLSLGIRMQKEKDTAKLKRERKTLARMMTALHEKQRTQGKQETQEKRKSSPVSPETPASPESRKELALKKAPRKAKISPPKS